MFVPMDYEQAHGFVEKSSRARWDGWDIVFFAPSDKAITSEKGVRHQGRWGFETRVSVLNNGTWEVPQQYVNESSGRARTRRREH
jgi:hypothetical protein